MKEAEVIRFRKLAANEASKPAKKQETKSNKQ
jgi:hypothetical protein